MSKAPFTHALVTGASSGIGASIAHKLGKAGVGMVLVARRKDRLDAIAARYPNVEVLVADLTTQVGILPSARAHDLFKSRGYFVSEGCRHGFYHDAHHWFGARGAQHDATIVAK